jgi:hypothetical protein
MDVRMPFGIITKSLNGHHSAADAIIQRKGCTEKGEQAFCCTCGQPGKQVPVIEKKFTYNDGNTENILAVWYGIKNIFPKYLAELDYLLCVA